MLTRLQIQDNIDALEEQGAQPDEIQEWLDSLPKQSSPAVEEPPKKNSMMKTFGKALISSELKFGKSIADAMPSFVPGSAAWTNKQNEEIMANQQKMMDNLLAHRKQLKKEGKDTSRIDDAIKDMQEQMSKAAIDINETNASVNKSAKQIFGEGLGVATDIASFGTYGNAAKGAQTGKLLVTGKASKAVAKILPVGTSVFEKTIPTATSKLAAFGKGFVEGAKTAVPIGASYGASASMQVDDELPTILKKSFTSAGVSGVIGGTLSGLANMRNVSPETLRKKLWRATNEDSMQQRRNTKSRLRKSYLNFLMKKHGVRERSSSRKLKVVSNSQRRNTRNWESSKEPLKPTGFFRKLMMRLEIILKAVEHSAKRQMQCKLPSIII
jgi:DNA-binding transcriptional MerR regulator